jgi:hypothetical protein
LLLCSNLTLLQACAVIDKFEGALAEIVAERKLSCAR